MIISKTEFFLLLQKKKEGSLKKVIYLTLTSGTQIVLEHKESIVGIDPLSGFVTVSYKTKEKDGNMIQFYIDDIILLQ